MSVDALKKMFDKVENPALKLAIQNTAIVPWDAQATKALDPNTTILLGDSVPVADIFQTFNDHSFRCFVQQDKEDFKYEVFGALLTMAIPKQIMKSPEPILMAPNFLSKVRFGEVRKTTIDFTSSKEKMDVLRAIEEFLMQDQKTDSHKDSMIMIADEMIANALFDAPVDKKGRPMFKNVPRTEEITYPEGKAPARIFLMADDHRMLIGCRDPWGSAQLRNMVSRLYAVFRGDGMAAVDVDTQGAGIGVKLMIDQSTGFYFLVNKGVETLVCCTLPLGLSRRKRLKTPKNIFMKEFKG